MVSWTNPLNIFFIITFFVLLVKSSHGKTPETDAEIRDMLQGILKDYDPRLRPDYLGPPVIVKADATILSFTKLDAINMMYTIDMFFRQRWIDHRLKHSLNETLTVIVGTKHPSDIIWTPDTVFINSVTSSMHHVTVNNHKLDIYPDGTVFWGTRVTVSPSCILDLKAYPMDMQNCHFEIVSYAYTSRHLKYEWQVKPGILIKDRTMAQFKLTDFETGAHEYIYVAGNYTVLNGTFHFERLMGFAILQIYIPSIAVVCVSWISLWIRRNATPARVALCITTLLTISTIWASVNAQLPRVNYVKAIDIFMMTSFCCVIFTLLEYTVVLNCYKILDIFRKRKRRKHSLKEDRMMLLSFSSLPSYRQVVLDEKGCNYVSPLNNNEIRRRHESHNTNAKEKKEKKKPDPAQRKKEEEENEKLAERIEIFARVFFPLAYAIFNVIYWITYLKKNSS